MTRYLSMSFYLRLFTLPEKKYEREPMTIKLFPQITILCVLLSACSCAEVTIDPGVGSGSGVGSDPSSEATSSLGEVSSTTKPTRPTDEIPTASVEESCQPDLNPYVGDFQVMDIDSLDELKQYTVITGDLIISSTRLSVIDDLELCKIEGSLRIVDNPNLVSISGFSQMTVVVGYVSIKGNPDLASLHGLENLESIGNDLFIDDNDSIQTVKGLESLRLVVGDLFIKNNENLYRIKETESLRMIGKGIFILKNPMLSSLRGLFDLESIGGGVSVENNKILPFCHVNKFIETLIREIGDVNVSTRNNGPAEVCN